MGQELHTYIGEQGTMMDEWRIEHNKKPLKFVLHICLSFTMNGGVLLGYGMYICIYILIECYLIDKFTLSMNLIIYSGIQSIISQFNVNPFRWPGWFITAMGGLFILAVLFIYMLMMFYYTEPSLPTLT